MSTKEIDNEDKILKLILPEYESFKMQSKFFVEQNKRSNKKKIKKEYFQNVSLLGERGSGKTYALNNLNSYLKNQNKDNYIVFDLITPEIINEEEDLLGWIISLVTEKSENILKEFKRSEEFENDYICKSCNQYTYEKQNKYKRLNVKIKELKESYFLRRSTYNEIITNDTLSTMEYIEKKSKKLKADTNLKSSFFNLIDEIVDNKDEKMLIFLFDDVDIYSSKVCEVLKIIMNYLSHKNIITYIAGDYNSFIENITIELIKKENLLDKDLLECEFLSGGKNAKKLRESRAYEFLKKVLPPKYRYYIKRINNKNKCEIIKEYNNDLKILEKNDLRVNKLLGYIKYNDYILYDYLDFLDDRIRGLKNIIDFVFKEYKKLKDEENEIKLRENEIKNIEIKKIRYNFLCKVLDCIIHTNIELEKYETLIKKIINIPSLNFSNINFNGYINYNFIIDELKIWQEKNNTKKITKKKFKQIYKIFMLSNFFEILIEIIINRNAIIHGKDELLKILNSISYNEKEIKLIPNLEELKSIIFMKERIFENLRYEEISCMFSGENKSNYIRYTYLKSFFKYGKFKQCSREQEVYYMVNSVFKKIIEQDFSWCDEQIRWIYNSSFNIKKVTEKFIKNINTKFKFIDDFFDFNNLESIIDFNQYKNNILPSKNILFNLNDIITFFDLIIPLTNYDDSINEEVKSIKIINDKILELEEEKKYIDIDNEFKTNKTFLIEEFERINFISNTMEKFIYDENIKLLVENVKGDVQVINGIIDKSSLDENLFESFTFKEINLENLIKKII